MAFRHNGIVPALAVGVALIILAVRHPRDPGRSRQVRIRLICVPLIAALMFGILKGPVFTYFRVIPNSSSTYVTMLCAVASCVNKDLPLSDEANEILEEVMPLEDWATYYHRYEGHDYYVWIREGGFDTSSITAAKAFRIYLEALFKYPDVVLKDRLDGMDILWDVAMPAESFNMRYFDGLYPASFLGDYFDLDELENTGFGYVNRAGISDLYRFLADFGSDTLPDMVLWRTGIYLILLLLLFVFWRANGVSLWLPSVPFLANLFASVLVVYYQCFRYVYFVQLFTVALIFLTVARLRADTLRRLPA